MNPAPPVISTRISRRPQQVSESRTRRSAIAVDRSPKLGKMDWIIEDPRPGVARIVPDRSVITPASPSGLRLLQLKRVVTGLHRRLLRYELSAACRNQDLPRLDLSQDFRDVAELSEQTGENARGVDGRSLIRKQRAEAKQHLLQRDVGDRRFDGRRQAGHERRVASTADNQALRLPLREQFPDPTRTSVTRMPRSDLPTRNALYAMFSSTPLKGSA